MLNVRPVRCSGFSACGWGWAGGGAVFVGLERASVMGTQTNVAMSWVVFVNTHGGWILCTLNLLRTCCVLSWALLLRLPPSSSLPLSLSFKDCGKDAAVSISYHAYTVVAGHLSSSPSSSSYSLLTDSDQLWHYAPWSFTLHGLCPSGSDRRASATLCLMLYSRWGFRTPQALIPKQEPKYLTFDKRRYQRSLSVLCFLSSLPCSMCVKRQTQHWL